MTTPPDDDFENDPTGMRDLLRSMPDPGPMPQDVAERITAALAQEHADRAGNEHSNVTPLTRTRRTDRAGKPAGGSGRRGMQVVGGLVAAAAVAAVAVVGVHALQDNRAPTSAVPSTHATHSASAEQLAERVQVQSTGTKYSNASFNTQAASMASDKDHQAPNPSLLAEFGSLAKPRTIVQCARTVGGSLLDDPSSIKVDLATYEGKPALIVVITKAGKQTAFAVSSSCSKDTEPYVTPRSI